MLNAKAFANATTAVGVIVFIICRLIAWIAPNFLFQIGQSWFHTIQLESSQMSNSVSVGILLLGLVSAVIVTWLITYGTISLYNKWAEKQNDLSKNYVLAVLDYSSRVSNLGYYEIILRSYMEKEKLTKASYAEYQASLFGACGIALALGIFLADYLKSFAVWLLLLGIAVHSYGMYKVHQRNKI